jgi:LAS superfamily LD-carboxypeptidase LdcB
MKDHATNSLPTVALSLLLLIVSFYGYDKINSLDGEVKTLSAEVSLAKSEASRALSSLSENREDLTLLKNTLGDVSAETKGLTTTITNTKQNIDDVKSQVGGVQQYVSSLSGSLDTLQKLAKIDPELLKKYSKVYFLSENYIPARLTTLPPEYAYSSARDERFLSEAWPHLKTMLDTAKSQGVSLYVKSGYRSFAEQKSLKNNYTVLYGKGTANSFSAEQGYSEHQLGTAVDFITTGLGGNLTGFDKTEGFAWLQNNAHRFGFIISYPKANGYYIYEPWHFRFVGVKLATYLHTNNKKFYDLEQKEIDTYLVSLFDSE